MDTQRKLLIDRAVATPLAWAANVGARALGSVMHRDRSVDGDSVRTIVVAKILGMGSIVQATPLLHAIKRRYPTARLVFLTSRANRALVDRLDVIDEAIYVDDASPLKLALGCAQAVGKLARQNVDLYFDLEVFSAGASVLSLLSIARNRYGFYRHSAQFKKGLFTHLVFFNPRVPIRELYLQLARVAFGGETASGGGPADRGAVTELGPIRITDADRAALARRLATVGIELEPRYVVANPNASDLLLERRWPKQRFAEAIACLAREGHQTVLIGAPGEKAYVDEVYDLIPKEERRRVINTAGLLRLEELFALLAKAGCVVTNDTGPMHFAVALGRPTVCLFGPVHPDHYGVRRPNVEILYAAVFCSPCVHETDLPPCAGKNVCMQRIDVADVVDGVLRLLAGQESLAFRAPRSLPTITTHGGVALGTITRASIK